MNKDFEQEFRSTVWKGLGGRELLFGGLALTAAILSAVVIWLAAGIPASLCIYLSIPVMVPFLLLGFYRYQGAGAGELVRELRYLHATRKLPYEAEERTGKERIFTMARQCHDRRKERK